MAIRVWWMNAAAVVLLAAGSVSQFKDKEGDAVALLTVALRGGGYRKCTGVAVGARAVLAAAGCVADMDDSKFVQVQLPLKLPQYASKLRKYPKKTFPAAGKKRRQKYIRQNAHMQTRFSRKIIRVPGSADERGGGGGSSGSGGGTVLLQLTAPLERAQEKMAPVAAERPPLLGHAPCRLFAWSLTSGVPPEARLVRSEAQAGNWSECWQRAGLDDDDDDDGGGGGSGTAGGRRLCASTDGCLPAATGAALLCQGALAGLVAPPTRAAAARCSSAPSARRCPGCRGSCLTSPRRPRGCRRWRSLGVDIAGVTATRRHSNAPTNHCCQMH